MAPQVATIEQLETFLIYSTVQAGVSKGTKPFDTSG